MDYKIGKTEINLLNPVSFINEKKKFHHVIFLRESARDLTIKSGILSMNIIHSSMA